MIIHEVKQGTQEWLDLRKGKLTGTTSKNVVAYREMLKSELIEEALGKGLEFDEKKIKVEELKDLLVKQDPDFSFRKLEEKINKDFEYKMIAFDLTGDPEKSPEEEENPMARGHRLEPIARKIFEKERGITVDEIGFVTLDEESRIGLSPDGLIKIDGKYKEALEIKSPCNWKYIKFWLEGVLPDEYKEQVLDYFVQSDEIRKVYLMIYNPLIEIHPHHIFEVTREEVKYDVQTLKNAQLRFWKEHDQRIEMVKQLAETLKGQ